MLIIYSFLYSLNLMMDLDSLKDSKSPNPPIGTNEKSSRITIVPSVVNIHFVSLLLCTVLYVNIVPLHNICYTLISHAHASLSFVYYSMCYLSILYLICLYLSITFTLFYVLSLHIISHMLVILHYLYIASVSISILYLLLVCFLL